MDDADLVCLVLGEVDRRLRAERPGLFVKVDRIKAEPDWRPFRHQQDVPLSGRTAECRWCGDEFLIQGRPQVCCSRAHASSYCKFLLKRKAADGS